MICTLVCTQIHTCSTGFAQCRSLGAQFYSLIFVHRSELALHALLTCTNIAVHFSCAAFGDSSVGSWYHAWSSNGCVVCRLPIRITADGEIATLHLPRPTVTAIECHAAAAPYQASLPASLHNHCGPPLSLITTSLSSYLDRSPVPTVFIRLQVIADFALSTSAKL